MRHDLFFGFSLIYQGSETLFSCGFDFHTHSSCYILYSFMSIYNYCRVAYRIIYMDSLKCACGSRLFDKGIDGDCKIYVCENKKCLQGYRVPVGLPAWHPLEFLEARKIVHVEMVNCKGCGSGMRLEAAKKSYEIYLKALCSDCAKKS